MSLGKIIQKARQNPTRLFEQQLMLTSIVKLYTG